MQGRQETQQSAGALFLPRVLALAALWIVRGPRDGGEEGVRLVLLLVPFAHELANPQRTRKPFRVTLIKTLFERDACCQKLYI